MYAELLRVQFFVIDIISLVLKKPSVREHAVEDSRAFPLDVAIYLAHPLSWWISCCRGATTRSWQDKNTVGRVLVTVRWPVGFRERKKEREKERGGGTSLFVFHAYFVTPQTALILRRARVRTRVN